MHGAEFCVKLLSLIFRLNILPVFLADLVPGSGGRGKFALKIHRDQKAGYFYRNLTQEIIREI